ncbi:uncharacterized protein LOC128197497 [Vigna angularis]|uniref:uncharacterized protein LOC128197497 n=1 Tax=Phaseolus angularis TaxID=3914 RepID=UPI0022B4A87D|nr:uncharacterized protein LOC128197497 [Vigna angularis]
MASGPSGPPILPSGNSDKGKGKKSYVVKLMTRFNNEIGSTSQPTTPTFTSTGRFVPPPLVVPAFTPTPLQVPTSTPTSIGTSLPPLIQVPGLTPTPYQGPPHRMASLSPNVGSNPSTPINIASSPGIEDADPHSSSAANYVEQCSNSRPMITPVGGGFYPTKTASKAITATIKEQFDEPWLTWGSIPKSTRDVFFERVKRRISWKPEDEEKVKKNYHTKASHRLSKMYKKARTLGKRPDWLGDDTWNALLEKWNMPLYRQKCETAKKNRTSEKGGCLHTGGYISVHEHAIRLSQELGRSVHVDEIFQQTHIRQSIGEFVDERSRRTHEQFVAKFSQIRSEIASFGVSTTSPLDPAEEERLRNQCWLEAAVGKYKGRVYGIGNFTSQDDCVDSYIQQTQASSTAQPKNSEEIVNLKSQLQQYGQQLQKFEGFIGVLLPFLPPSAAAAAQDFLNLQNLKFKMKYPIMSNQNSNLQNSNHHTSNHQMNNHKMEMITCIIRHFIELISIIVELI